MVSTPRTCEEPARIAVIGCGHVGLVMAAGLAALGHHVTGIDINGELVDRLNSGRVDIHEPDLPDVVHQGLEGGLLAFTTRYDEAIPRVGYIFLAVDTPQTLGGAADLRNIRAATHSIAANLNGTTPIIINKSTSPIGTGETIEEILSAAITEQHRLPRIVSNPEFLRQGSALWDFFHPERIVVGSRSSDDARAVAELYAALPGEIIVTDLRTAEMIKYVANAFLATRVSFINEIARLCEHVGSNIDVVVEGIALDPRIGGHFFRPGIGYGGSCLPKDVAALRYIGETMGVSTPILSAVQEVNNVAKTSAVRRLRARLGPLEGRTIGVWGLTFKGGTEDTRDSPAMDVVALLRNEGARVRAYDPAVAQDYGRVPVGCRPILCNEPIDAVAGADALAILTDWPEFREIDLELVRIAMAGRVLFDGRNMLNKATVERLGFAYLGVGRTSTAHRRRQSDS
ncbi:MAG: UDP-glucose/GDP-mannose dehydrogenase family protein [Isosphaeraceae bacterium]|nr:UDP-glucose/GDP-mannose dehydrogenase family protein [Isosphaeraceae bacterium]